MVHSRRGFLQRAASAAALGLLAQIPRPLWAMPLRDIVPEPDEALLRDLAFRAIDAARAAGASFADVRLAVARSVTVWCKCEKGGSGPRMGPPALDLTAGYGVRAIVDGAWGFGSGVELTPDAITQTARIAVAAARANRPRHRRVLELAPAPRVTGTWATPIAQDPFAVSILEQGELQRAAVAAGMTATNTDSATTQFEWRRPVSVFASTDGSLAVQRLSLAWPNCGVVARIGPDTWSWAPAEVDLPIGGYGYEAIGAPTLAAEMRGAAERAIALARAARSPTMAEPGRYDLVFSPEMVAVLLTETVADALNAERALGYLANAEGTSFAAPPADMLGKYQIASSLVTVHADRSRPHGAATTAWDDEGVQPEDHTLVKNGIITDYQTGRQVAAELVAGTRGPCEPPRSHGCARRTGTLRPVVCVPNLTLEPGAGTTTANDLIADVKRGFYIEGGGGGTDQQVLTGQFSSSHRRVRQITNGRLGGHVKHLAFQFLVPQLWRSLDALGGKATVRSVTAATDGAGIRDQRQPFPRSTITAVPARVRQVNVLNTGSRA